MRELTDKEIDLFDSKRLIPELNVPRYRSKPGLKVKSTQRSALINYGALFNSSGKRRLRTS